MDIGNYNDPNKSEGKKFAKYRVLKEGGLTYFAKEMDADQISERRMYLRKVLLQYPRWANLPNDELDSIRFDDVGKCCILEDGAGYEFILPHNKIPSSETEFRKARAMMPFEFLNLTGKDFDWDRYKDNKTVPEGRKMVNDYIVKYQRLKDKGMGLYIYSGTKGSGKTMLACCLINEILKRYPGNTKFVNILDFLEMTKKGFNGKDEDVNAIYQAGLLVIDDIGVQMSKEWIDTVLYRLINDRYINRLPTIYTSNVPIDNLKMDERIKDRIESTTYLVKLPEESIRKEDRQQEKQKLLDEIENAP